MRTKCLCGRRRPERVRPLSLVVGMLAALAPVSLAAAGTSVLPNPEHPTARPASAIPLGASRLGGHGGQAESSPRNIVLAWNDAALDAIVATSMGPPMVTRALAIAHTCMYDAWAAYDPVAVGTQLGGTLHQPATEWTRAKKEEAISFAAYRALVDLFPTERDRFDAVMADYGFDPDNATDDMTTAAGVGNVACGAVLEARRTDGANQRGEMNGGAPYSDYTSYQPVNSSTELVDPVRWQPLATPAGDQRFLAPHWGWVRSFALPPPESVRPVRPPPLSDARYRERADQLLAISAGLTDRQKMIAEYWADGPGSVTPPGHWNLLAAFVSARDEHSLDEDVKLYFALNNAMFDAGIAVWDCKRDYDYVRPVSAIRHLYAGQAIAAWSRNAGTRVIDGADWTPYIDTPPFAEYVSGHSTFSASAAEVLKRFTGGDAFGASVLLPRHSSVVEPAVTPQSDLVLSWATFSEAADEAGISRRYGGIHFEEGDLAGRRLGRLAGEHMWDLASRYFDGNVPAVEITMQADRVVVAVGETVRYAISVRNNSKQPVPDMAVLVPLPSAMTFVAMSAAQGLYVPETGFWHLGDLPADTTVTLTLDAFIQAGGATTAVAELVGTGDLDTTAAGAWAAWTINAQGISAEPPDPDLDPERDSSGDRLPDVWMSQMGLDPARAQAGEDPDGDGLANIDEHRLGTHPRGFHRTYFAEGAASAFFQTELGLMNVSGEVPARVVVSLSPEAGEPVSRFAMLGPQQRMSVHPAAMLGTGASLFATVVESDVPVAADRMMSWDEREYGSTSDRGVSEPSTRWYFAEGATTPFELFYLLQNVSPTETVQVKIRYLRTAGDPVTKTYTLAPRGRTTVYVNQYPELERQLISAEIIADGPIVAERAMYLHSGGTVFGAGHVTSGAPRPSHEWLFAEGATTFFDTFLLIAVPGTEAGEAVVRYLLPDGRTLTKRHTLAPESRSTIWVNNEDAALASTAVAIAVTADVPIVAERAMWWPGSATAGGWYEATAVMGATEPGTTWLVPGGADGGDGSEQTYVLIANQAADAGEARVTVVFDDHTRVERRVELAASSRTTLNIGAMIPDARDRDFSVIVESIGPVPVPVVVECARYSSASGLVLGAGSAEIATRIE